MRAKVASRAHTHALDERLLRLNPLQLSLLYRQAIVDENEEKKERIDVINRVNNIWSEKLNELFKSIQIFINPQMYQKLEEMEKIKVLREDISADNFEEVWDEMLKVIPDTYEVEDRQIDVLETLPEIDDEMTELIAGWVSQSNELTFKEEGE